MMHGIINIDKPQNMTSHDVVAKLRRILGMKRIGHTGTLDPMATGVLPVCLGSATRITEYLDLDFKTYRCTMGLGMITDTQEMYWRHFPPRGLPRRESEPPLSPFTAVSIKNRPCIVQFGWKADGFMSMPGKENRWTSNPARYI